MQVMIKGQSHIQPFGLPYWGSENLNKGAGSMTASYDYHIGVDYHKSYSHLVVQDSGGKTLRSGRVKNDRQSLAGFSSATGRTRMRLSRPPATGW